jgi:MoaA/NifB/PqqE/SkfB family radical SAM enzyme
MSNANPTEIAKSAKAGKPPEAIFLTGRFRSGTTLLWNIFRNLDNCIAYYEPLNELLPTHLIRNFPVSRDHRGVDAYWDEYNPIQEKVLHEHRAEFALKKLVLEAKDEYPELEKYLRLLLQSSGAKIPVLGFCRVDFRLPWLKNKFPGAKIVHIYRNPRDQWTSMVKNLPADQQQRADVNTSYDLVAWSLAMAKEFPFLTGDFVKSSYHRHYLLWRLSKRVADRYADWSMDYTEQLCVQPAETIAGMLDAVGLSGPIETLTKLIHVSSPKKPRAAAADKWMSNVENECDKFLESLGLADTSDKAALTNILPPRRRSWWRFRPPDDVAPVITNALSLVLAARTESAERCNAMQRRIRLIDSLYNSSRGGVKFVPREAAKVKFFGRPEENRKLAAEERAAGRIVLESLPPITTFALTTQCNNRRPCLICDRNVRPPEGDFDTNAAVVRAMEPLIRTASVLLLHTGGEAMMSKYYDDVIDMVNPPTEVTFATNAMLMNHKRADRMLARPIMCKIVISLDAATSEIYRIHRPGSKFETVVDNVKYYIAQAKSLGRKKAQVELNMTVCKSNLRDVPKLVDLAVEVGASGISFQRLNSGLSFVLKTVDGDTWDYKDQSTFENPSVVDRTILDTYRLAKQAGLEVSYMGSFLKETVADPTQADVIKELTGKIPFDEEGKFHNHPEKEGLARCLKRWEEVCVMPDGNVRACYYHLVPQYVVGNVIDQDFMAVWNSDLMIQERAMVVMNRWPASCLNAPAICSHRGRV